MRYDSGAGTSVALLRINKKEYHAVKCDPSMERMLVSDDWEPGARTFDHRRVTVVSSGIDSLLNTLPVSKGRARRRQVLKTKGVRILRLSLDAGQSLIERAESAPLLIQTLQGRVALVIDGERVDMPAGAIIHLERQTPHSITAVETSHVMVTLLGPRVTKPRVDSYSTARASLHHGLTTREASQLAMGPFEPESSGVREWARHNSVLAATGPDADAFDEITRRHAEILGELASRTAALLDQLAGDGQYAQGVADLLGWVRESVLPHLLLESKVLYPVVAVRPQQRPLVSALEEGLVAITGAVQRLSGAVSGVRFDLASAAVALRVVIGRHLAAESEMLLPTLAISADESLAALWARMEEGLAVPIAV